MAKLAKRIRAIKEKIEPGKLYLASDALTLLKECSTVKFDESVEVSINLGVDARKSDQMIRGAVLLPHGTGKTVRVAVFAQSSKADEARDAGADIVGFEDLVETVKAGEMNFDVVIATPDAMPVVSKLGQILGPRGLMPNPKVGTVTSDVATAVKNAKAGQIQYRIDKAGIIHAGIGKISFDASKLLDNLNALLMKIKKAKPASAKGIYLKKITLSSTMGPGLGIDLASVD